MELKIWPWERKVKPYWTNPENGVEWYVDETTTQYANRELSNNPSLDAMCFLVVEIVDGERNPATRILISKKTNKILIEDGSLEGMGAKIDILRFANSFND